jgi:hypothetical protein
VGIRITVTCDKPAPDPHKTTDGGLVGWGTCPARYHATTDDIARALVMAQRADWLISQGRHFCPRHNPAHLAPPGHRRRRALSTDGDGDGVGDGSAAHAR